MSTNPFPVTADKALQILSKWQQRQNRGRRVPQLSELEKQSNRDNAVHIYNVGPWEETTNDQGTLGTFHLIACPPNERYVRCLILDGTVSELVIDDETKFKRQGDPGRFVAEDILGLGKMRDRKRSLIHKGFFVGSKVGPDAIPLEKELSSAKALLRAYMLGIFKDHDDAWALGPEKFSQVSSVDGIMAARYLERVEVGWMKSSNPTHNVKCPKCGTRSEPDVMMCPTMNCNHIFDVARYVAYEAEQKLRLEAAMKGK